MPIEFGANLLENDDFKADTNNSGDLILEHKQTGLQFKADSGKNAWVPVQGLDLEGANLDNAVLGTALDANNNDINNAASVTTESLGTKVQSTNWHYAGEYSGADPDARLDAALSAAGVSEHVILEAADYTDARTISTFGLCIEGPSVGSAGAEISGSWTLSADAIVLQNVRKQTNTLTISGQRCRFQEADNQSGVSINVSGDEALIKGINGGSVTFESGTSNGLVDSSTSVFVTDNGTNTVGDIS